MRKSIVISTLALSLAVIGAAPAFANGGGMGDPSQHLKDMNAICEMQRRGEGPLSPNLCLPDYPVAPGEGRHGRDPY